MSFYVLVILCWRQTVLKLSKDQQGNLKTKGPGFQASRVPDHEQVCHLSFVSVCGRAPCAWHCPKHLTKINSLNLYNNPMRWTPLLFCFSGEEPEVVTYLTQGHIAGFR